MALLFTLALLSQVFFKTSNRHASFFDCLSAVKEVYGTWRGAPALAWLVQDVLRLAAGNAIGARVTGVLLFIGLPSILWFQNLWQADSL